MLKQRPLERVATWLSDHYVEVGQPTFSAVVAAFVGVATGLDDVPGWNGWPWCIVAGGIVGQIWIAALGIRARRSRRELEIQLERSENLSSLLVENQREMLQGILSSLAKTLQFGSESENSERITLYVHDKDSKFVPIARHSMNPSYEADGRSTYPDDQGCISAAWRNDWYFRDSLPDPDDEFEAYVEAHATMGVPREVVEGLNMRSRLYVGIRIECDDIRRTPLAVIIVESTKAGRFNERSVKTALDRQSNSLSMVLERLLPHLSIPSVATEAEL